MMRIILYILFLAVLIFSVVWLRTNAGWVRIDWLGWRVDTSVTVMLVVLGGLVGLGVLLIWLLRFAIVLPKTIGTWRSKRRAIQGYLALLDGVAALNAGQGDRARRLIAAADERLENPALTALARAQAADMCGHPVEAEKIYRNLMQHEETELLGLRGLLLRAQETGDDEQALILARRAHELAPEAAWAARALLELLVAGGEWEEAGHVLREAHRHRHVSSEEQTDAHVRVLLGKAQEAFDLGLFSETSDLAGKALDLDQRNAAAAALVARGLAAQGKTRRAYSVIEKAWARYPHPVLSDAFVAVEPEMRPEDRLRRGRQLTGPAPHDTEGHLLIARLALDAGEWAIARDALQALEASGRLSARGMALMARLEEGENGSLAAANAWLRRALEAGDDVPPPSPIDQDASLTELLAADPPAPDSPPQPEPDPPADSESGSDSDSGSGPDTNADAPKEAPGAPPDSDGAGEPRTPSGGGTAHAA